MPVERGEQNTLPTKFARLNEKNFGGTRRQPCKRATAVMRKPYAGGGGECRVVVVEGASFVIAVLSAIRPEFPSG